MSLQDEYNTVLARYHKACEYMDGDAPISERMIWLPEFIKILRQLNHLTLRLKADGISMTGQEVWEGFEERRLGGC